MTVTSFDVPPVPHVFFARTRTKYVPAPTPFAVSCVAALPVSLTTKSLRPSDETSYVERQNLSMRMGMRRFTRLTNGFSKKAENHAHMVALYFAHYNFARVHGTLRTTPAMAGGIADHVWSLEEIVGLLDTRSAVAA
jgi:hypothetical protein